MGENCEYSSVNERQKRCFTLDKNRKELRKAVETTRRIVSYIDDKKENEPICILLWIQEKTLLLKSFTGRTYRDIKTEKKTSSKRRKTQLVDDITERDIECLASLSLDDPLLLRPSLSVAVLL